MTRPGRAAAPLLALVLLAAGCASAAGNASPGPAAAAPPSLDTATVTAGGVWAVAVMGGSAAQHNEFWQLFTLPAGSTRWRLVTPPGVASNGGLVITALNGQSLLAGFRPSQYLVFTPLAVTRDSGASWSPGVLDAALADVPGALAADQGSSSVLALLSSGTVQFSGDGGTRWSTLATRRSVASSAAGRRCGLTALTSAAFGAGGRPMLAGTCANPGMAGVFTRTGHTWQAAGPALPSSVGRRSVTVLRLAQQTGGTAALLAAGTGQAESLIAAWSAAGGGQWTQSPPLRLDGAAVTSASFGPGGAAAVVLTGRRGAAVASAGGAWHALPELPAGTATLAPVPGGGLDALAVHGSRLSVWQLPPGGAGWTATQTINVPIEYGSSS